MKKLSLLLIMLTVALSSFADLTYTYTRTDIGSWFYRVTIQEVGDYYIMQSQGGMELQISFDSTIEPYEQCYIKNIVAGSEMEFGDYWVYGYYDTVSSTITVPLNQVIMSRGRAARLKWGTVHYNAATQQHSFVANDAVTEATYVVDGNSIHIENTDGPVAIDAQEDVSYDATGLALTWEDEEGEENDGWTGYMEWGTEAVDVVDDIPDVITHQPEGTVRHYTRTSELISNFPLDYSKDMTDTYTAMATSKEDATIVFGDNGKVYIHNPFYAPTYDSWVEGSMSDDGNSITFPHGQVLSYNLSNGWAPKMYWGSSYVDVSDNTMYFNMMNHSIVFLVDGDNLYLEESSSDINAAFPDNFAATGMYIDLDETKVVEANVVYTLKGDDPVEPTQVTGAPTFNGYTTDGIHAYFVEIRPTEPSTIHYRVQYPDGHWSEWAVYEDVLNFTGEGKHRVEAYAVAAGKRPSEEIAYEFVVAPVTGIDEMAAGKTVAGVRYYNMAGQEMAAPEGFTIQVTTFTDGTSSAVKVVK